MVAELRVHEKEYDEEGVGHDGLVVECGAERRTRGS